MKIRILHIIASPVIGGAEKLLLTLLRNYNIEKIDLILGIYVIVGGRNTNLFWDEASKTGAMIERIRIRHPYGLTQVFDLYRIIKKYRPHIIHTHGYKTNLLGYFISQYFRVPIIATYHGWLHFNNFKSTIVKKVESKILPHFDLIIAVSDQIKKGLSRKGIPLEKIITLNNVPAIDGNNRKYEKVILKKELNISPETSVIGFVGRLEYVKGCEFFIKAAAIIIKRFPDCRFVIFGAGSEQKKLEELARELNIEKWIKFMGFCRGTDKVFQMLDVYAMPSLSEGVPLTLLEAMYYGVPVVATNVGGVPEIIQHNIHARFVPPKDIEILAEAIIETLVNCDSTEAMVKAAKLKVDTDFSIGNWVGKIENVYFNLIQKTTKLNEY